MSDDLKLIPDPYFTDTRITCTAQLCQYFNRYDYKCRLKETGLDQDGKCVNYLEPKDDDNE